MPLYFFDVKGLASIRDEGGVVCSDIIAAKRQAALLASGLLRDAPDHIWGGGDLTVSVRSSSGLQLFSIVVLGLTTPAIFGRSFSAH